MKPDSKNASGIVSRRAIEKQASRLADEQAIRSGQKSADELRRENGHFALRGRLRLDKARSLA